MSNSKFNKKNYYNKRYHTKAKAILESIGMEDEQIEFFLLLPMSDKDLYELALELQADLEKTEKHLEECDGCDKCVETVDINEINV
jgi:hypothetical protein